MPIISTFPTGSGGSGGGGGIPLAPVTGVATLAASGKAYLKWTDSIDTVVGDATLAAWAGTLLVRKVQCQQIDVMVRLSLTIRHVINISLNIFVIAV